MLVRTILPRICELLHDHVSQLACLQIHVLFWEAASRIGIVSKVLGGVAAFALFFQKIFLTSPMEETQLYDVDIR